MKATVTFRTRQQAEALRSRIKADYPAAYFSIYFLRSRYAITVSGDVPDDVITRYNK